MKVCRILLLSYLVVFLVGCDVKEEPLFVDMLPPEIKNARWVDHPSLSNDPVGTIANGMNYKINIRDGYQFAFEVKDVSIITKGVVYVEVNDNPDIRVNVLLEDNELGFRESTIGFVHRADRIAMRSGGFYDLKNGDKYSFFLQFWDEHGNTSEMSWTADIEE